MFIIKLTYKAPINEIDKYLAQHREFLDNYYRKGLLIVSGPLKPRTGGIVIAATNDRIMLESIMKQDPFHMADIAEYEYIEFTPVKHCEALRSCIQETEGNLC